jgi:hypothetical protein
MSTRAVTLPAVVFCERTPTRSVKTAGTLRVSEENRRSPRNPVDFPLGAIVPPLPSYDGDAGNYLRTVIVTCSPHYIRD